MPAVQGGLDGRQAGVEGYMTGAAPRAVSMTGHGQGEAQAGGTTFRCEIRSVNGRGLSVRLRLPVEAPGLEATIEDAVRRKVGRGTVSVQVRAERPGGAVAPRRIDDAAAELAARKLKRLAKRTGLTEPVLADVLVAPGVVIADGPQPVAAGRAVKKAVATALADLAAERAREGAAVAADIDKHAARAEALVGRIGRAEPAAARRAAKALHRRAAEMALGLAIEDRALAAEALRAVDRSDTSEERARLEEHLGEVRRLLRTGGAHGRRLDFLGQECGREAGTLSAKAGEPTQARRAVDLRVAVDRIREQVANVE